MLIGLWMCLDVVVGGRDFEGTCVVRAGYAAAGVKIEPSGGVIEPSGGVMYSMGIAFCRCPGTSAVTHCDRQGHARCLWPVGLGLWALARLTRLTLSLTLLTSSSRKPQPPQKYQQPPTTHRITICTNASPSLAKPCQAFRQPSRHVRHIALTSRKAHAWRLPES